MVEKEVLKLYDMSVGELKSLWRQYFDSEPIWKTKRFYIPRLAYLMQELEYGGVPENVKNSVPVDGNLVHKSGDETIGGTKTFSASPILPTPAVGDSSAKGATTAYVNNKFKKVSALPANPDANTYYFIPE